MPGKTDDRPRPQPPGPADGTTHGSPAVPLVKQPDPASPQFQKEAQEEIEKEKLDP
jgi:hypothetical protein